MADIRLEQSRSKHDGVVVMNYTSSLFIQILGDHLHGRKTESRAEVDWKEMLALAQAHEVGGIVYFQCKEAIPHQFLSDFEKEYSAALFFYCNRKKAMGVVDQTLTDFTHCAVKGLEVAEYFPFPPLRTMGDCDIVVELSSFENAIQSLRSIGFTGTDDTEAQEWSCDYKGMHFEIHNTLVKSTEYTNAAQVDFFNNFSPYIVNNKLDWNFHFLFLIMHLRKHFIGNGVGIRQFIDIAAIIKNNPNLNWLWIEERLSELKLQGFAHACYSIIEDWFEITAPVSFRRVDDETTQIVTEKILGNGIFGFDDDSNHNNKAMNTILMNSGSILANRLRYFISKLFPDYMRMKRYPGCDFLKGRKWLLPLAWLKRLIYIIGNKDNHNRVETIKSTFTSEEDLKKRKELMTQMGILDE